MLYTYMYSFNIFRLCDKKRAFFFIREYFSPLCPSLISRWVGNPGLEDSTDVALHNFSDTVPAQPLVYSREACFFSACSKRDGNRTTTDA